MAGLSFWVPRELLFLVTPTPKCYHFGHDFRTESSPP
jgi:hypothetical protein